MKDSEEHVTEARDVGGRIADTLSSGTQWKRLADSLCIVYDIDRQCKTVETSGRQ